MTLNTRSGFQRDTSGSLNANRAILFPRLREIAGARLIVRGSENGGVAV